MIVIMADWALERFFGAVLAGKVIGLDYKTVTSSFQRNIFGFGSAKYKYDKSKMTQGGTAYFLACPGQNP